MQLAIPTILATGYCFDLLPSSLSPSLSLFLGLATRLISVQIYCALSVAFAFPTLLLASGCVMMVVPVKVQVQGPLAVAVAAAVAGPSP